MCLKALKVYLLSVCNAINVLAQTLNYYSTLKPYSITLDKSFQNFSKINHA